MTARRFIKLTLVVNLALAVPAVVLCLVLGDVGMAAAAGAGALVGVANLTLIGLIVTRMFSSGSGIAGTVVVLILKVGALAGLAALALVWFSVDGVGLVAGISASVLSVAMTSAFVAARGVEIEL